MTASVSVRARLLAALASWELALPAELDDDTDLFAGGVLDSLGLFRLAMWIEESTGRPTDPSQYDLRGEWATIGHIVRFVEARRGGAAAPAMRAPVATPRPPPGSAYRVIRYTPEFRDKVSQLQTGLWSPAADLNLRYLDWKFARNPYATGAPLIYLALHGDELVGMRGFHETRWEIGSRRHTLPVADDLMVASAHRDKGVHTAIMQAAFADLANMPFTHTLNLSASPVNVIGSLAMGWRSVGLLEPLGKRQSRVARRQRLRAMLGRTPVVWRFANSRTLFSATEKAPFDAIDRATARSGPAQQSVVPERRPRIARMVELIESVPHDGRIRHSRDADYLAWRYANPIFDYRFLYVGEERLHGYAALGHYASAPSASGRVRIVDIEARNDDVYRALLHAAARYVDDLQVWTATMSAAQRSALRNEGFAPVERDRASLGWPCILVRTLGGQDDWTIEGQPLLDMRTWDMRMLYSMNS